MSESKWLPPTEPDAARQIVERMEQLVIDLEAGAIEHDDYRGLRAAIFKDAEWLDARTQWPPPTDAAAEQLARAIHEHWYVHMQRYTVEWDKLPMDVKTDKKRDAAAVLARLADGAQGDA